MKVRIVTAYVPIPNHPRTAAEYGELGEKFGELPFPVKAFYNQVKDCWLHKFLWEQPNREKITHSEGDNPAKNSLAYHTVQHNKFEWLGAATKIDDEADTFVWMDYGIMHQPGVTVAVIEKFIRRVWVDPVEDAVTIPGCWPVNYENYGDENPNWRFCGSLFIVPRALVKPLALEFRDITTRRIFKTHRITWEVNDLARLERKKKVPIRWYQANHDNTMFDNYPGGL